MFKTVFRDACCMESRASIIYSGRMKMRTIPQISEMIQPLENAIRDHLIPALTEKHFCNVIERKLLSLPVRLGGLGIINPCEIADHEFSNSVKLTSTLTNAIIEQKTDPIQPDDEARREITKENKLFHESRQKNVEESLSETQLRMHMINQQKGASSWLTVLPTIEHGFHLSKRIFWDSIRLRYGWPLSNLPSSCACGKPYNITHALSCHLGGFTTIRHNELRDLTAELLKHVCYDVQTEPLLEPLTGETFELRSTITAPEARLDVSARGVFLDMSKAFDKVWHEGLVFKLKTYGIEIECLNLLQNYLADRQQRVVLNGVTSKWENIYAGVPQGSVLGPLLFLIYINDLPDNVTNSTVKMFADDTSIFSTVNCPKNSLLALNSDLKVINDWALQWKMRFNPDPNKQANEVIFSRKKIEQNHHPLTFNDSIVQIVSSQKHLGLILDQKLNFLKHTEDKISKANTKELGY